MPKVIDFGVTVDGDKGVEDTQRAYEFTEGYPLFPRDVILGFACAVILEPTYETHPYAVVVATWSMGAYSGEVTGLHALAIAFDHEVVSYGEKALDAALD
jgi:hypothetical protein